MKIVGVVQARLSSTRLPGKVLLPIGGRPMLERMLGRLARARQLDALVVATTDLAVDRPIAALAERLRLPCVEGNATDLIERHLVAALATRADAVVKIPSDCPLIDPEIVDRVVATYRDAAGALDYVSNLHPASWPDGNDVEIFSRRALEAAFVEADRPHEREHTTPFLWDQPSRFRLANVTWSGGRDLSRSHRLTVDHREDFEVVSAIFAALGRGGPAHDPSHAHPMEKGGEDRFSIDDVVAFLDDNPVVRELNARHRNTGWPSDHEHLLRTGTNAERRFLGAEARP